MANRDYNQGRGDYGRGYAERERMGREGGAAGTTARTANPSNS